MIRRATLQAVRRGGAAPAAAPLGAGNFVSPQLRAVRGFATKTGTNLDAAANGAAVNGLNNNIGTASINKNPVQARAFSAIASADAAGIEAVEQLGAERSAKFKRTKSAVCQDTLKQMQESGDFGPKKNFNTVRSYRESKGVSEAAAVDLRADPEAAKKIFGAPIKDHADSTYTGDNTVLKYFGRLTFTNPYLLFVAGISSWRVYKQYYGDENDAHYSTAAYPWMALAKEKRRDGHQSWVEFYMQRPVSEVDVNDRYKDVNGKDIYHWRKFDNTKIVKTNSYRPGGKEIEKEKVKKEMLMAEQEGVPLHKVMKRTRSNGAGLYDSQGIHDGNRTPEFTKQVRAEAAEELKVSAAAA